MRRAGSLLHTGYSRHGPVTPRNREGEAPADHEIARTGTTEAHIWSMGDFSGQWETSLTLDGTISCGVVRGGSVPPTETKANSFITSMLTDISRPHHGSPLSHSVAIALQGITPSLGGGLANWLTRLRAATHRDGHMGQPFEPAQYDEVRFHAFLALEEERTRRSRRPFLLLLVDIEDPLEHGNVAMADDLAVALFDGLKGVLRETDFVGWHEQGLVVGAVLTQLSDPKPGHAAVSYTHLTLPTKA